MNDTEQAGPEKAEEKGSDKRIAPRKKLPGGGVPEERPEKGAVPRKTRLGGGKLGAREEKQTEEKQVYKQLMNRAEGDPEFGERVYQWILGQGCPMAEVLLAVDEKIEVSVSTVERFRHWWEMKRELLNPHDRASACVRIMKRRHPEIPEEELANMGQVMFEELALEEQKQKEFVEMQKLRLARRLILFKEEMGAGKMRLESRKVALQEKKARLRQMEMEKKKEKKALKGGISTETLAEIEEKARLL